VLAVLFLVHSDIVNITEIYGMNCELFPNDKDGCLMKSPQNVPNATVSTPCMRVDYDVSDDDILTASIVADNVINDVPFKAGTKINYIRLSDLPSMYFTVSFAAKRILTPEDRTEYARITKVELGSCDLSGM